MEIIKIPEKYRANCKLTSAKNVLTAAKTFLTSAS
jgi:hypothetical protein